MSRPIRTLQLFPVALLLIVAASTVIETDSSTFDEAEVTVHAAGVGNPRVNYGDGEAIQIAQLPVASYPLQMTPGDLNGDGIEDLAAGFRWGNQGAILILEGNEASVFSPSGEIATPFDGVSRIDVPIVPDYLETGDFDADGTNDIVIGTVGGRELYWIFGDGQKGWGRRRWTFLDGDLTALYAGDLNRSDGLADLALGVATDSGFELEVLEDPAGASNAGVQRLAFSTQIRSIAGGFIDDLYEADLAVGSTDALTIISGRDRFQGIDVPESWRVEPSPTKVVSIPGTLTSLQIGDFLGDSRNEVAILTDDGNILIHDPNGEASFRLVQSFRGATTLLASRASTWKKMDLAVVAAGDRRIRLLTQEHLQWAIPLPLAVQPEADWVSTAPAPFEFVASYPIEAVETMRLNQDGLLDFLTIGKTPSGRTVASAIRSAPMTTFTVNDSGADPDADIHDGKCATQAGTCTFAAAAANANFSEGADMIVFSVGNVVADKPHARLTETVTVDGTSSGRVEVTGTWSEVNFSEDAVNCVVRGMAVGEISGYSTLTIENNFVEVAKDGVSVLHGSGINLYGLNSVVGGTNGLARNVVRRLQLQGRYHQVVGNYLGVDVSGTTGLEQNQAVRGGGDDHTIRSNVIAGGQTPLEANGGRGWLVEKNLIGTTPDGRTAIPSTSFGVWLAGSAHTVRDNVISGSAFHGLGIVGDSIRVQGNLVGTDKLGEADLGNDQYGITVFSSAQHTVVGGATASAANVVSGNRRGGISVSCDGPVLIQGNMIGTKSDGSSPLGNDGEGIYLASDSASVIGGSLAGAGNVVAHNGEEGIVVAGAGNEISYNRIFHNGENGIAIASNSANVRNRLSHNAIYGNGYLGISLGNSSLPRDNDEGDVDTGPNDRQNHPELLSQNGPNLLVKMNSTAGTRFEIEFFGSEECDESGFGEGEDYLESLSVTTDAAGLFALSRGFSVTDRQAFITATATDPDGNTSEFSNCVQIEPSIATLLVKVIRTFRGTDEVQRNTTLEVFPADGGQFVKEEDAVLLETDENGIVNVGSVISGSGRPFLIRQFLSATSSARPGHEAVDGLVGFSELDNLIISKDGSIKPDVIASDRDTTVTYLNHPVLAYNFVASVEWTTSDAYIDGLENMFRRACNLLYDVSNGQVRLNKIAIYDNKEKWDVADIRVAASNTAWPRAGHFAIAGKHGTPMTLPAVVYGKEITYLLSKGRPSRSHNFLASFLDPQLDPYRLPMAQSVVHEFGHYALALLDEYQDMAGKMVAPNTNFGIMDDAFGSEPMASEFSVFVTDGYRDTEQYQRTFATSWDYVAENWALFSPKWYGLNATEYMAGPNDNLDEPDSDVGARMDFVRFTSHDAVTRRDVKLLDSQGKSPSKSAAVDLVRTDGRVISQGQALTDFQSALIGVPAGTARVLGGAPGDQIIAYSASSGLVTEFAKVTIPTGKRSSDDPLVVQLKAVDTGVRMQAALEASNDDVPVFRLLTSGDLLEPPSLEFLNDAGEPQTLELVRDAAGYAADLTSWPQTNTLWLHLVSTELDPFALPHRIEQVSMDTSAYVSPSFGLMRIYPENDMTATQIVIMTSPLPVDPSGVSDEMVLVSRPVSILGLPTDATLDLRLQLGLQVDSLLPATDDAVTVFRIAEEGWEARPTVANVRFQTATAHVTTAGTYVALLDPEKATALRVADERPLPKENSEIRIQVYPNPFVSSASIRVTLPAASGVRLSVLNVLGQEVKRLIDGPLPAGVHETVFDGESLPAGLYFARLSIDDRHTAAQLVKVK